MTEQRRLLTAFTALDPTYPPYLNISQFPNGDVEVTVRSPAQAHPSKRFQDTGPTATIRMKAADFQRSWLETAKEFRS